MKRNVFITVCIALAVSTGIFFSQGEDKSVEGPVNNKLPKAQRIDKALEWRILVFVLSADIHKALDFTRHQTAIDAL